jgi:hypothetical protein
MKKGERGRRGMEGVMREGGRREEEEIRSPEDGKWGSDPRGIQKRTSPFF